MLKIFRLFLSVYFLQILSLSAQPKQPLVEWIEAQPDQDSPQTIYIDGFEDGKTLQSKYADFDSHSGDLAIINSVSFGNSGHCVRGHWASGQVGAGYMTYMFGRNPIKSQSHSDSDFDEIFWRFYMRVSKNWTGNPFKLTRATIFASSNWAQAMIGHVWGDNSSDLRLALDPASGVNSNGDLVTTKYNDFNNLKWLGLKRTVNDIYDNSRNQSWYCIEVHIKLNTLGQSDGIFELWVDDFLEVRRDDLNWRSTWDDYGINAVLFANYWNSGAIREQERYLDNLVIASNRIGMAYAPINPVIQKTQYESSGQADSQSSFQAQISTSESSENLVWQGSITGKENQIRVSKEYGNFSGDLSGLTSLKKDKAYYARVRQVDNNSNLSDWSPWKIFITGLDSSDTIPPNKPVNLKIISN